MPSWSYTAVMTRAEAIWWYAQSFHCHVTVCSIMQLDDDDPAIVTFSIRTEEPLVNCLIQLMLSEFGGDEDWEMTRVADDDDDSDADYSDADDIDFDDFDVEY
ncbi:hypothetical protein Q8F55_007324 [Vanrija albida]|uniref:Uncharacterized protein n=1 Tax=Vanrija albida TaxID=181172 RepID=A0ABR3PZJ1_9TREE